MDRVSTAETFETTAEAVVVMVAFLFVDELFDHDR